MKRPETIIFGGILLVFALLLAGAIYCGQSSVRAVFVTNPTYKFGDCVHAKGFYETADYGIIQDFYGGTYYLRKDEKLNVRYKVKLYTINGLFVSTTDVEIFESQLTRCATDE